MKERLTKNLGLKLLSVFLAFVAWLVIVNISNPEVTRTKSVAVEIVNEEVILGAAKTYEITGGGNITVSYEVRTRDEYKIKASDFRAYIDLADLYDITGSVPVKVDVVNNKDIIVGTPAARPGIVRIKTEDVQRKLFDLTTNTAGAPAEGFSVGEIKLSPKDIYLSGPVSLIGQISSVGVEINVDGAGEDLHGTTSPVFYDANGNMISIDDPRLTFDATDIEYEVILLRGKSLALNFEVGGDVMEGYRYTGAECSTKSVSVVGLKSDLANLTTVDIPEETLNIEGATQDKSIVLDVNDYLPENVRAVGNTQITVTLKVEALNKKSYQLTLEDMEEIGHTYGYAYRLSPERITVVLSGLQEDLESLEVPELNTKIDFTHLSRGSHEGSLTFDIPGSFKVDSYTPFDIIVSDADDIQETEESSEESGSSTESAAESSKAEESKAEAESTKSPESTKAAE